MAVKGVLRTVENDAVMFFCPGCKSNHLVYVGPQRRDGKPRWKFNEDYEHPTFYPSINVTYNGTDAGIDGAPPAICHSFVTDGNIQFLNDCTHSLAGQTVSLAAPEIVENVEA